MKNNLIYESIVAFVLIGFSVLLLNPWNFWMPNFLVMCLLTFLVASFALFAIFIIREKGGDEREVQHRMIAGRTAFLVGSSVMIIGIIVQTLKHEVDFWLVIALISMVIAKFGARSYAEKKS